MIDILVQRGAGVNEAPSVVDPYLGSLPGALERGKYEINSSASYERVQLTTVWRAGVEMGHIVSVADAEQGATWIGKIIGIEHSVAAAKTLTKLTILRPVA